MGQLHSSRYPHIFTVIVTYGDRYQLLQEVVHAAFANGVEKVIIIDNASTPSSRQAIQKLEADSDGKVVLLALAENRGSAGGFKAGLEYARTCSDCDYLWLLDDDNRPADGALEELLRQHANLSESVELDRLALVCLRKDQEYYNKLAHGVPQKKVFARESSFMGFHLLDQPRKFSEFFQVKRALPQQVANKSPIEIPFAPYGGLFLHKSVVAKLGYPDERFFVYCDDTEYTYRLTKSGGRLFLVPSSVVHDLQRPWHVLKRGETFFSHLLIADSDLRIYYVTRNQSYLERHFWMRCLITYTLNKWAFFLFLSLFALRHGKWKRLALIARAAGHGEAGELGRAAEW
jgi:GT2 family glycosyltransferase